MTRDRLLMTNNDASAAPTRPLAAIIELDGFFEDLPMLILKMDEDKEYGECKRQHLKITNAR